MTSKLVPESSSTKGKAGDSPSVVSTLVAASTLSFSCDALVASIETDESGLSPYQLEIGASKWKVSKKDHELDVRDLALVHLDTRQLVSVGSIIATFSPAQANISLGLVEACWVAAAIKGLLEVAAVIRPHLPPPSEVRSSYPVP